MLCVFVCVCVYTKKHENVISLGDFLETVNY